MRIKGLDTLRVFAIVVILIYHFFDKILPAGFLGVNILFVLSGYLLMRNFLKEINQTGHIHLGRFINRRFIRIVPAILLMLIISLVFVQFVSTDYLVGLPQQVAAVLSFNTNWYEILNGGSYEAQFIKHIFLHTWFLALEIHFYILMPVLILAILQVAKKKALDFKGIKIYLKRLLLALTLISYLILYIGVLTGKLSTSFNYFSDFTRMNSLFLGAFLAVFLEDHQIPRLSPALALGTLTVVTLILSLLLNYNDQQTYLVGFFVIDVLTAFAIAQCLNAEHVYEPKLITKLASCTYGVYIFHYPFMVMVTSLTSSFIKYPIMLFLITGAVILNQKIWEPLFRGEEIAFLPLKPKSFRARLLVLASPFLIIALTGLVRYREPDMLSLEKQIWEKTVEGDVQKIEADINNLSQSVKMAGGDTLADSSRDVKILMPADMHKKGSISVIGDSVALGPKNYLESSVSNLSVDAKGSRLLEVGADVIRELRQQNQLGEYVVVALGTNNQDSPKYYLKEILKAIPAGRKVVFVTPYNGRDNLTYVAEAMRKIAKANKYIAIMDWQAFSEKHPEFYEGTDKIHFYGKEDAYKAYKNLLMEALQEAKKKGAKP